MDRWYQTTVRTLCSMTPLSKPKVKGRVKREQIRTPRRKGSELSTAVSPGGKVSVLTGPRKARLL